MNNDNNNNDNNNNNNNQQQQQQQSTTINNNQHTFIAIRSRESVDASTRGIVESTVSPFPFISTLVYEYE